MFNKSPKPSAMPDTKAENGPPAIPMPNTKPAAPKASTMSNPRAEMISPSVFSSDMSIKGSIITNGDVQIDGVVEGDVRAGKLSIGDTAQVFGEITAESIEVRGKVIGSVRARKVHLYTNAHVEGDIITSVFAVESGAYFDGRCKHDQDPIKGLIMSHEAEDDMDIPAMSFSGKSKSAGTAPSSASVTPLKSSAEPVDAELNEDSKQAESA